MSDYDLLPRAAVPKPPVPAPAPKSPAPKPAASRLPTAEDLVSPRGEPALDGVDSATLAAVIRSYVTQIFSTLAAAQSNAFAALREPPPPADRSFALQVLAQLVGALAAFATAGIGSAVFRSVEEQISRDARAALAKALTTAAATGVTGALTTPAAPGRATNPAAATLLDEFQAKQEQSLTVQHGIAERQLIVAAGAMRDAHPAALRPLIDALAARAGAATLRADYIHRVAIGWLGFCSAISLGPRRTGQPAMPGANRVGGSVDPAWRRAHAGFVEIHVDFPDRVDGMTGVQLGEIGVDSGPGAARILRQSGHTLGELPVYRRLWLGTNRLDRAPDVIITPDHRLEVNGGSSLLAAIGTRARGSLAALTREGGAEEAERARLLDKASAPEPHAADPDAGPLGPLVARRPLPGTGERTPSDDRRLAGLEARRVLRAAAAQRGALELWTWLAPTSTDRVGG